MRDATLVHTASSTRSNRSSYITLMLVLVLLGGLYTAFAAPQSKAEDTPLAQQSLAIKEGAALFATGCSTCHGLNLQGGAGGPSLIGSGGAAVVFQVGSGRMPLVAGQVQAGRKKVKYTQSEIEQMAAYVQANGGGPEVPKGNLTDGDLALGGDLFRTNCASCHSAGGVGGALTYGKYAPKLGPATPEVIYAAMQSGPESMPRFSVNQLNDNQKRAITNYVYDTTHTAQPGGAALGKYGPVPEGLVVWLVGIGALVVMTLWIGARA